jgi:hypothetical protein
MHCTQVSFGYTSCNDTKIQELRLKQHEQTI